MSDEPAQIAFTVVYSGPEKCFRIERLERRYVKGEWASHEDAQRAAERMRTTTSGSNMQEFLDALGAKIVGEVFPDGGVFRWQCGCGDVGEAGTEQLASLTLHFHRRSGHKDIIDVQIGTQDE